MEADNETALNVEVQKVQQNTLAEHRIYVLKHTIQIYHDEELTGGPLDNPITRQPDLPPYTLKSHFIDSKDAYQQVRSDQLGESKVDKYGKLLGARKYLLNTFRLPQKSWNLYVLVSDLVSVLGFLNGEEAFLQKYDQLYKLEATGAEKKALYNHGMIDSVDKEVSYVTARSVFVRFGAAVIATGCRIVDDYWELHLKEQGFTIHYRVFPLTELQLSLVRQLKPIPKKTEAPAEETSVDWLHRWEAPYPTIQEQSSVDIRREYAKEHSHGEHTTAIVPGQSINGALELGLNYMVPKYHYKNSFANALQHNIEDVPIGKHKAIETVSSAPVGRPSKRPDELKTQVSERNHSLNINGWKFESLPLVTKGLCQGRTSKGLPYYEKDRLLCRLRKLTPNQVRELEHVHDSLNLNTGLGKLRYSRSIKWSKYWQYKSGAPIGITADQVTDFEKYYLPAVLQHVETESVYDEDRNVDIIQATSREPNANFLKHSNIRGFKPPYA
ncbi:HDL564Wp [Eremothecium sinecaudum]|uniref:HDL564Wp n=1 Tax=Eremothecium sinecaudum TaxID=45286 RepID=A0A0X8HRM2_9SACH|nr:HDL564Wp [Eremothecium sinecaudum]AMD20180.1 HDL564Wp [Eremothecium sinecaudum]